MSLNWEGRQERSGDRSDIPCFLPGKTVEADIVPLEVASFLVAQPLPLLLGAPLQGTQTKHILTSQQRSR